MSVNPQKNYRKYLKAVDLVGGGMRIKDAASKAGISQFVYAYYKNKDNKVAARKKPRVTSIQVDAPPHKRVAIIIVDPSSVGEILRGLQ